MSFTPSDGELFREAIGSHEVEADLVTREYAHLHPDSDLPRERRPGLVARLLQRARGRQPAE